MLILNSLPRCIYVRSMIKNKLAMRKETRATAAPVIPDTRGLESKIEQKSNKWSHKMYVYHR